jgi:hypothetical protein
VESTARSRFRSDSMGRRNAANDVRLPEARTIVMLQAISARHAPAPSADRAAATSH